MSRKASPRSCLNSLRELFLSKNPLFYTLKRFQYDPKLRDAIRKEIISELGLIKDSYKFHTKKMLMLLLLMVMSPIIPSLECHIFGLFL